MIECVDEADDPRLEAYRGVPDPELLRRRRLFVAEGRLVVRTLLEQSRLACRSLLLTPPALAGLSEVVERLPASTPVYVVSQATMNLVGGFNFHRGCLALGERPPEVSDPAALAALSAGPIVVLEGVGNADNVGGVFRNAAAFGADLVLLGPGCCDPLYRKTIRTSAGAALRVPFGALRDWPADLARLRAAGWRIAALTPGAGAAPVDELAPGWTGRTVLVLGTEGAGLSPEALGAADALVRIPMARGVDSLNVATAAGIALFVLRASRPAAPEDGGS